MTMARSATPRNRLLAWLPKEEYDRLAPLLEPVPLHLKQVIHTTRDPIHYVYFPNSGLVSAMTVMEDGRSIEVATVGNEGMVGLTAFVGDRNSPTEMMVQMEGEGLRMSAAALERETRGDGPLRRALVLYNTAFQVQVSYSVACNGLHTIDKRCCRWLLTTQDRIGSDELPLTHEFLGVMLGVRRSSVTDVLKELQERGLIESRRGKIRILDRPGMKAMSCECHGAIVQEYDRLLG